LKLDSTDFLDRAENTHKIVNRWIVDNMCYFSPQKENNTQKHNFKFKALVELCLYIHLWEELGFKDNPPSDIKAPLKKLVTSPSFLSLILARPVDTINGIVCILPFHDTEIYQVILKYYRDICQPFNNEMLPFDVLSHVYIHDVTNIFDNTIEKIELQALALSALNMPPNGLTSSSLGAYPLTHTIFYATRFGRKHVLLSKDNAYKIEYTLDIEIAKAYTCHNIDVALELVLSRIFLFNKISRSDYLILISAIELVEDSGFLVAPPQDAESLFLDEHEKQWSKQYHSMLVLGILLGVILSKPEDIEIDFSLSINKNNLKDIALNVDSLGAIYSAVESGNLPIAALLYSRLKDLPIENRPSKAVLEHFEKYVQRIYSIFSENYGENEIFFGKGINVWSMTPEEFSKIMEVFKQ
jgi:hypothetical protein